MSLHIGRLSSDVQHKYLRHVFERFGRCTVNLKDGYGFAVYDSNADAARAMRAMWGRYICGQEITVNWSKQQPRSPQGFRRSSRFVESSRGRASRDGGDNVRFRDFLSQKDHSTSHDQGLNPEAAPEKESDKLAKGANDAGDNTDEDPGEVMRDEGGTVTVTVDADAIEHDRWPETGKGTPGGDGDDFERYEPYHGYDRQEGTENVTKTSSYDSHGHRHSSKKSQEHSGKRVDVGHEKSRSLPTCYTCGASGHIARNCPQEIDSKFKARRDGLNFREKWELRQRRFWSPSRRRPELHVRPMDRTRYHRVHDGGRPFSEVNRRVPRLSHVPTENRRHALYRENLLPASKEARKRSRSQKSRGSSLSPEPSKHSRQDNIRESHSNRTSSDSRSRSPSSRSRFRAHSPSCSAHSTSKSSQPTQREGSRSNINNHVPLSAFASPEHKSSSIVKNENLDVIMDSPFEDSLDFSATPELIHEDDNKQEGKASELNTTTLNLDTLSNGKSLVPGKVANVAGYNGLNLDKNLVDDCDDNGANKGMNKDNNLVDDYDDNGADKVQKQKANFDDTSSVKSNKDVLTKNGRGKSLKLTSNEVISALKHYRMEAQELDSSDLPVERYFGAARLWPWEIIYYRRRKKGPISTENYARRLEQNKEFGIVDQYVRSSSGWWECH